MVAREHQPLRFITHGRKHLKQMLHGEIPEDLPTALRIFQTWYRGNPAKTALLFNPNATLSIGCADFDNPSFRIGGETISTQLSAPTPRARASVACRMTVRDDEPAGLRRRGEEIDHANEGGFVAIFDEFLQRHDMETLLAHVVKARGVAREVLRAPLREEFLALHRQRTNNWRLCASMSRAEHRDLTKRRRVGGGDAQRDLRSYFQEPAAEPETEP